MGEAEGPALQSGLVGEKVAVFAVFHDDDDEITG